MPRRQWPAATYRRTLAGPRGCISERNLTKRQARHSQRSRWVRRAAGNCAGRRIPRPSACDAPSRWPPGVVGDDGWLGGSRWRLFQTRANGQYWSSHPGTATFSQMPVGIRVAREQQPAAGRPFRTVPEQIRAIPGVGRNQRPIARICENVQWPSLQYNTGYFS
jgi:hypothetical protein